MLPQHLNIQQQTHFPPASCAFSGTWCDSWPLCRARSGTSAILPTQDIPWFYEPPHKSTQQWRLRRWTNSYFFWYMPCQHFSVFNKSAPTKLSVWTPSFPNCSSTLSPGHFEIMFFPWLLFPTWKSYSNIFKRLVYLGQILTEIYI